MALTYRYKTLPTGCIYCERSTNLLFCNKCKVAEFCREHKHMHLEAEQAGKCKFIGSAYGWMEHSFNLYQEFLASDATTQPMATISPQMVEFRRGIFHGACYTLARSMRLVVTRRSIEYQAFYLDIARDSKGWWTDIVLPAMYIRLGKDSRAWGLIREWTNYYIKCRTPPHQVLYLRSLNNTTPFDDPYPLFQCHGCQLPVMATLIKIRMLVDLESVDAVREAARQRLPQEILEMVATNIPSTDIIAQEQDLSFNDHIRDVKVLQKHIMWLFRRVDSECSDFWPYIQYGYRPHIRTCKCTSGSLFPGDHCVWDSSLNRVAVRDAWLESPGAIEYLKELLDIFW
ncbi:hypothetical protein P170DRAFT_474857 [Aspergillus steynii IBT 23096]|uniref:MYND-type zinc finger protein samB n=1 Tax=Aspergillus steynii IBT 23096 TaxID=1392250 RepID=A0A2I2GEJ9_9EURO|nr:uncharacterized protein P170DRAFT_474857 [Aspergillus steynii IBT 23096]PLB51315.1 hypothetical protein P170DRAFT_474857 [Aspergillus steynii IBT 23096]